MNRARTWLVGMLLTAAAWTVYAGNEGGAPGAPIEDREEPALTNQAFRVDAPGGPTCPPEGRRNDIYDMLIILPLFGIGWALTHAARQWRKRRRARPGPPTPSIR